MQPLNPPPSVRLARMVQALAEEVHRDEGGDQRRRDGDGADQHPPQVVEEEEDDDDGQQSAQDEADVDVFEGAFDPRRLVLGHDEMDAAGEFGDGMRRPVRLPVPRRRGRNSW